MYSHGFATLFLAEIYGMTGDEQVKEKLQRAVRLIEKTQNPEGGCRCATRWTVEREAALVMMRSDLA